jgi:hypothetical protein
MQKKENKSDKKLVFIKRNKSDSGSLSDIEIAQNDFNAKLNEIVEFISGWTNFKVYNGANDGRVVSWEKEVKISQAITDEFDWAYNKSGNRDPGDFYIKVSTGHTFPVNIKLIANFNKSYNNMSGVCSTISRLLFNKVISGRKRLTNELFHNDQFTEEPVQYGFIAVNKTSGEVKAFTMFNINDFILNPSNGFQFKFDGVETVNRTQLEGQLFLKDKFIDLIKKEAEPYLLWLELNKA